MSQSGSRTGSAATLQRALNKIWKLFFTRATFKSILPTFYEHFLNQVPFAINYKYKQEKLSKTILLKKATCPMFVK